MISQLTGRIECVAEQSIDIRLGPMLLTILTPACDVESHRSQIGDEVNLFTLLYLEGDPNRGNLEPRMIGFASLHDREFFELFTTVKGIGPKTALRALAEPVSSIATWIESKDSRSLTKLSGIGKRTAELIVAELAGKCSKFAIGEAITVSGKPTRSFKRSPEHEDAIRALVALGERPIDASILLDRVLSSDPDLKGTEALVTEMLRQRG